MDRAAVDTTFLIDLQNERRGRGAVVAYATRPSNQS